MCRLTLDQIDFYVYFVPKSTTHIVHAFKLTNCKETDDNVKKKFLFFRKNVLLSETIVTFDKRWYPKTWVVICNKCLTGMESLSIHVHSVLKRQWVACTSILYFKVLRSYNGIYKDVCGWIRGTELLNKLGFLSLIEGLSIR